MNWWDDIFEFLGQNMSTARELTHTLYGASSPNEEYYWFNALVFDAFQRGWESLITTAEQMKEHEPDSEDCTEPREVE